MKKTSGKIRNVSVKRSNQRTLRAMRADPDHPVHGTVRGYNLGCDCSACRSREVYGQILIARESIRRRALSDDEGLAPHGTESRYKYGCRCDGCRRSHAEHRRNEREHRRNERNG